MGTSGAIQFMTAPSGAQNSTISFTEQMRITNSGVGIGTTSPATKLHVVGDTYFNGNVGIGTSSPSLKLHVAGQSYFTDKVGVGIGITNPTEKLDIAGVIRAHRVKVCLNQGCDFVFEDDYKLMSLNELSSFIKTNKHLPDVAPAAVMEAVGIELSEMNALLLRKIEELTLHLIEQNEKLQMLESEINKLKNK